eukprot:NODE_182_length_15748_cov_0.173174.p5 type:complete len:343 gc:universal NODE_182_length_15748_cov_0.173174:11026-9998(-)
MIEKQLELINGKIEIEKLRNQRESNRIDFYKVIAENRSDSEIIQIANVIAKLDQELFGEKGGQCLSPEFKSDQYENNSNILDKLRELDNYSGTMGLKKRATQPQTLTSSSTEVQPIDSDSFFFGVPADDLISHSTNDETSKTSDPRIKYKILVAGPSISGKTTFLELLDNGKYLKEHRATAATKARSFEVEGKWGPELTSMTFVLVDTPGNYTLFKENCLSNCKEADGILLFYDISDPGSYTENGLTKWHRYVRSRCRKGVPIVVCGNKRDLETSFTTNKFTQVFDDNIEFCKLSCKTPEHHKYPFVALARKILGSKAYKVTVRPVSRRQRNMKHFSGLSAP